MARRGILIQLFSALPAGGVAFLLLSLNYFSLLRATQSEPLVTLLPRAWAEESPVTPQIVKLGIISALTGDFALFGEDIQKGAELAASEINQDHERVKLLFEDDKCLPKDGLVAFKKLVDINKVDLVIGSGCTGVISTIGPVAERLGKFVIALLDTNEVTKKAGRTTFIIGFDAADLAGLVAREMIRRGYRKAGLWYETDAWAEFVSRKFREQYEAAGGKILAEVEQRVDDADHRPGLTKLIAAKAEALYMIPAYNGGRVIVQARAMGIGLPLFGPDTMGNQSVLETAGDNANGVVFANIVLDATNERVKNMQHKIRTRFGKEAATPFYAALGYDSVRLAYKAFTSGKPLAEALQNIDCIDCVTPVSGFDKERMAKVPPVLLEIRNGQVSQLLPQ